MPDARSTSRADTALSAVSALASRVACVVIPAVLAVAVFSLVADGSQRSGHRGADHADLGKLVASTTGTRLPRAGQDARPFAATDGAVVHPRRPLPVYAAPGRRPFAKITPQQMGATWLPVVDVHGDWSEVLLPSRPNGSTGWLRNAQLEERHTPYLIRVHVASRRLDLLRDGRRIGAWSVAVGAPSTPTPTGRTFLLGSIVDDAQSYSPVILPLGAHSDTLDAYGGGPGTVALHCWPDASVFGSAASHGCVRVPPDALAQLRQVPLGTLVIVDQQ